MTARSATSTPYLSVDLAVLERNISAMAASARHRGLALRPHAKTHKCSEVAQLQVAAGAAGLTLATVSEAARFAAAGFRDIFVAYPLWVDAQRGRRIRALSEQCALRVGVDSAEGAEALARNAGGGAPIEVLIEVDSGHHRTEVSPESAGVLARAALGAGLVVRGLFTFPGHAYGPSMPAPAAESERTALAEAERSLESAGVRAGVLSGGSTPSAAHSSWPVNEIRPGSYVFNDAQQLELGTCGVEDIALTAVATVVSRSPGHVVLNAGGKVLGADRLAWATGYGRLAEHPDARICALSEHHATVHWPAHTQPPSLGDELRVVPNHVCAAVNLADELIVVSAGEVVDVWSVMARGANG